MSKTVITPTEREAWQARERHRLYDGTYQRLPDAWLRSSWYLCCSSNGVLNNYHYAHVSLDDGTMIAYTENDEKGHLDRQTKAKPGRYLKKYYGHVLNDDQIRDLATQLCAKFDPPTLKITQDADEIERVYVNGPRSCMSGHANQYNAGIHPARAYAGPDLAIAYIEQSKGVITARAVIWPARKKRSRIYGDYTRLNELLVAEGYKERDQGMEGARLQRIPCADGFVVPYVDYASSATDKGEYLLIDNKGSRDAVILSNTCGTSEGNHNICDHCGTRMHPDDSYSISDCDGLYCNGCYEELTFECEYYHERYHVDEMVELENGTCWSQLAFDRYGFVCPINDTNHAALDGVMAPDDSGELWSQEAVDAYQEEKDERAA